MPLRPETLTFLQDLERFSKRKLHYREEVGLLLEVANQNGKLEEFDEAIFLAKFITKSMGVMKRIGVDGEGYDKLSAEFQVNIQKVSGILRNILEGAPQKAREDVASAFLSLTQGALENLVALLSDLAIVKNWVLDGKQLPREPAAR
jgi:hypothetical protein